MNIINELASEKGEKGSKANQEVALKCIENPDFLDDLINFIDLKNTKLLGDICEVFTETAKINPELTIPYFDILIELTKHKNGRVQWESMHCIALMAHLIPEIGNYLDELSEKIRTYKGVIVRDYAIDTISNYAKISYETASSAYPILIEALSLWECKHTAKVIQGLKNVLEQLPDLKDEIAKLIEPFISHQSSRIQKEAKRLKKQLIS